MIRALLAASAALLAVTASAAAAEKIEATTARPVLKAEALVTGSIVRIGDLVEHAGIIANVPIFRAPDLGSTGVVPADDVVEAVREHALVGLDTAGLSEVVVTRASRAIPAADVEASVARALSTRFGLGDIKDIAVNFEREPRAIYVEPSAKGDPRVAHIDFDKRSGQFEATLDMPTGAGARGFLRMSGRATVVADVVTVSHAIERGVQLKDSDILIERRPRAEIGRDAITDRARAVGLATRVALQPGRAIRTTELMKPEMVQRNETVTLVYQVPGITVTVRGKAAEGGAEGDVISVLNEQSKRTVQGVVVGPGRVVISTQPPRLAANLPPTSSTSGRQ
jgi:flagella basal body P-ring formation protein FlgA